MSPLPSVSIKNLEYLTLPTGSMSFPETVTHQIATRFDTADQALSELDDNKESWAHLELKEKINLLKEALQDLDGLGYAWVTASLRAKGMRPGGFAEGEEWFIFGAVQRLVRMLSMSLSDRMKSGHPRPAGKIRVLANGQVSVPAFPDSFKEKILFLSHHAETWLEPEVTVEGMFKVPSSTEGKVALVLGAGNVGAIPCADMLHFLFIEGDVVVLKMNPFNDYLGPLIETGFQGLIRRGYLRILYGGAELGNYLCENPLVEHIHVTGSDKTFERIVFGTGEEAARRKATCTSRLNKPVTAELGCINPLILVPGDWQEKDYHRAALMLVTWLYSNAGFSCLTPRLIVTQKNWPGRQAFLDVFRQIFAETPSRPAYYPGSQENRLRFLEVHPEAEQYGLQLSNSEADQSIEHLPLTFIPDLNPDSIDEVCFTNEPFGTLISETAIEAGSPAEFLALATDFVNRQVWGTLSVTLFTPRRVEKDRDTRAALQKAIADLEYGTICLNIFAGFVYLTTNTPWGSYPNQPVNDIQSGVGFTNNPLSLNRPQKSIFYAPFQRIDPVSIRNRYIVPFCRCYAEFQAHPSVGRLIKLLGLGMKG